MRAYLTAVAVVLLGVALLPAAEPDPKDIAFFETKVRPVLIQHCYSCHSADAEKAKKLKGGLHLDTRDGVRKGGDSGPALVPGQPQKSLLVTALRHEDMKMPPNRKLPDDVIADLVKWVEMGAPDPRTATATVSSKRVIDIDVGKKYWAFRPLVAAPPPPGGGAWVKTPVDEFIMAKLHEKKLTPNPAADREKLIRRAYYDLWGLPPSPEAVQESLSDASPEWYGKLVDRLLESPRYGERWGRHWLDTMRFAESGGYEFDKDRPGAYQYRDFVIKAFNQDMPYDEFVRLQLAGDQLQPGDFWASSATGFIVAGPYPGQTTAKTAQIIRYDHLDDMLSTIGTSMLGLSLGCARCHEHKYDPIPQEDYYRLLAAFARTDSVEAKLDPKPEVYRAAKATFDAAHSPLLAARDKFEKEELPGRIAKWIAEQRDKPAATWLTLDLTSTSKTPFTKRDDGSLLATGAAPKSETYTFTGQTDYKGIVAIRVEALADPALPKMGPGRGPDGNFALTEITLMAATAGGKAKPVPVKLKAGPASFEQQGHPVAGAVDTDKKTGWSIGGETGKDHSAIFTAEMAIGSDAGTVLTLTLKFESDGHAIGRPRVSFATMADAKIDGATERQHGRELLRLLESQQGQVNDKNRKAAIHWYRGLDAEATRVYDAVEQHARQEPQPALVPAFIAGQKGGGDVHFLIRGEVDRKNGIAQPGYIQVLMNTPDRDAHWTKTANPKGPPPVQSRAALAQWITDAPHGGGVLLSRVIVNRLWQHHFGRGIVGTPNDFGVQGEPPTHPELLDYLAGELIKNGWKLKPIQKLIMTSAVYAQNGAVNEAALKADSQNRLWWRYPTRRLEAEAIRDAVLSVSGTLDLTMHGQGTLDENAARRSVYLTVKRSRLVPLLQMFDAPEAIQSVGARPTTTVATQALAMMNSPFVRQRAEKFAQRIKPRSPQELGQAIENAYRIALTRLPSAEERERMLAFIEQQMESYGRTPKAADQAMTDFCQLLLCLNEFVYVE